MIRKALVAALVGFLLGLLFPVGSGPSPDSLPVQAAHNRSGSIRFTHPAAKINNQHTPGDLTQAWHGTGSHALDFVTVPYASPHGAHVHVVAWHDNTFGYVASTHSWYQSPAEMTPSTCHEIRVFFHNVTAPYESEAEYVLLHATNVGYNRWWEVWGTPNGKMNDEFAGTTATSEPNAATTCPWTGAHIHETHRNQGGNTFYKNTARYDCTCDPDADWLNWWNDHTRGVTWQ